MAARTQDFYTPVKTPIDKLLEKRSSNTMIVYITGDKQPVMSTKIHQEVLPLFYELLNEIGKKNKISLFLYSSGGSLEAPWAIANLLREYCNKLEIIVPFKAFSAATLLCLSADYILMTPLSVLSPVDPTGIFKIKDETKHVQVEDITSFIDFSKQKLGLTKQESLTEVLKSLGSEIPPSKLGAVNRTHSLIRKVSSKMLSLSKISMTAAEKKKLVNNLTEKLFSHNHHISRKEAKEIGFKNVRFATKEEEDLINSIYNYFVKKMELNKPFLPHEYFTETTNEHEITLPRAVISSPAGAFVFRSKYKLTRRIMPDGKENININANDLFWQKV